MTKPRAPLTFERALIRIADVLGWPAIAEIAGKDERTVRNWSEPDTPATMPLRCAPLLDAAYRAAGGQGAPLLQCYTLHLEFETAHACADHRAAAQATATVAKEAGEALAAAVIATQPGASHEEKARALLQLEEMTGAAQNTAVRLRALMEADNVQSPGGETN